ncbi:MAG: ATP synthase F0 subunit A [Candidatus Omnitrophota bacterium]|jgi:F-type H+-transporting ATPase subunit a|nr:MAG: ATP synthase F0 subunit A [Candidatus Omnitrophota bacterium]
MEAAHEAVQNAAEHGEHAAHAPELPNLVHVLNHYFPNLVSQDSFLWHFQLQFFALLVIGMIAVFFYIACKKRAVRPGRLQAFAEMIVEGLLGVVCGILGEKEGRRYFPFLGSLFLFIVCMNWFGLIPLMRSPTSDLRVTASLAICVFLFVQATALKRLGPSKFLYHLMGEPKDAIGWCLVPLFLPLHIMEEFIKPLSLACRLYGNIFGEDLLLGVAMLLGCGLMLAIWPGSFFGIPLHFPFVLLAMLLSTIQALVFTLLATVYISMVLPHEEHEHEEA